MIVQKEPSISDVENWWSQMLKPTRDYETIVNALKPVLFQLNPKLVAIDGRYGTGKTTLGRYLSWRFNSTLIETDQYLSTGIAYDYVEIKRLITKRLDKKDQYLSKG